MNKAGYKKLIVWKEADLLAKLVYKATRNFPKEESYGITSQLRRAIISVPLNIVEGYARGGQKEFKRFLSIALGSLAEAEYLIDFSYDMQYLSKTSYDEVVWQRQSVGNLLWKFYINVK